MNDKQSLARGAFVVDLRAECAAYQKLLSLLEAEQTCLLNGDAESLQVISRGKSDSVLDLLRLGERRGHYLRARSLSADRAGMQEWLCKEGGADRDELHEAWGELMETAQRASELNDVNGTLITSRLAHNKQALESLRDKIGRAHV